MRIQLGVPRKYLAGTCQEIDLALSSLIHSWGCQGRRKRLRNPRSWHSNCEKLLRGQREARPGWEEHGSLEQKTALCSEAVSWGKAFYLGWTLVFFPPSPLPISHRIGDCNSERQLLKKQFHRPRHRKISKQSACLMVRRASRVSDRRVT